MTHFIPSVLNLRTDRLYRSCLDSGGHTPSDIIVRRDTGIYYDMPYVECARCKVPYRKQGIRRYGTSYVEGAA